MTSDLVPVSGSGLAGQDLAGALGRILAGQLTGSSITKYRRSFAAYLAFAAGRGLDPLSSGALMDWRDNMALETDLSPNTINNRLTAVKRVMAEAAKRGWVVKDTADAFDAVDGVSARALKSRLRQHARTPISPEVMRRICEHPDPATLVGLRDRALLFLLASSGCRVSEVVGLRLDAFRRKGRGWVVEVMGKRDTMPRPAPVTVEAKGHVDRWLAARPILSDWVITGFAGRGARPLDKPLTATSAWSIVQGHASAVGLEHVKPHDFRRFVGTRLAKEDVKMAQAVLGHADPATTLRHYVFPDEVDGATDDLF